MPPISTYRIVNAQGGRWMILEPDNQVVLANADYPSPELAAEAVCRLAAEHGKEAKVLVNREKKPDGVEVVGGVEQAPLRSSIPVRLALEVSTEFVDFLRDLAADMGKDPSEVMRLALGLLRIAIDARREGNRVAIVTPDDQVDQDITGI